MLSFKLFKSSEAFTLIELMVVIAIIGILSAIAIPNFIHFRNKAFCSEAESDANHIAMAISDYFGMGKHVGLPDTEDLKIKIANFSEVKGDPNTTIFILVTDRTSRCPQTYQEANEHWSNDVFTKYVQ